MACKEHLQSFSKRVPVLDIGGSEIPSYVRFQRAMGVQQGEKGRVSNVSLNEQSAF
jgi:hypothetical protein